MRIAVHFSDKVVDVKVKTINDVVWSTIFFAGGSLHSTMLDVTFAIGDHISFDDHGSIWIKQKQGV